LTVIGKASEELSIAEATSALGNNGALAPVVERRGLFVAQPIALGVIDDPRAGLVHTDHVR
jgi:hypothetical protein